jgi:phosphate:Na+ symporter
LFHTLFNLLGLVVMTPFIRQMVTLLERYVQAPAADRTQPLYLNPASLEVPAAAVESVRKELNRLYQNAFRLIAHGISLHRGTIKSKQDLGAAVAASRRLMPVDIDEYYERHIKQLHSAIIDFISQAQSPSLPQSESDQLSALREASRHIAESVKAMKHLHKNLSRAMMSNDRSRQNHYDAIRLQLASVLRELEALQENGFNGNTVLSLDAVQLELREAGRQREAALDLAIRTRQITPLQATSLMNDNGYANDICVNLLAMARILFSHQPPTLQEAESRLALEDADLDELLAQRQSDG